MATTNLTLYGKNSRQISPAVVNLFQANNNVDSLEFQMKEYNQDNVDLSKLDPYVICYGSEFVGGLDEVKLTSEVTADGVLRVYWDLTIMSLSSPQTITAQLVFKNAEGAVWTSHKFIIFCNESLTADEEIVAQYPTILKQMEGRIDTKTDEAIIEINQIADNFDASVVYIPYGETLPVENRLNNRLYYQYTDEEHTKGRFEDCNGTILISDPTGYATHVGQTIFSLLPIDNAGLHLLDGAKIFGDGGYSDFVEYVAKLYDKSLNCFCTEDEWQQSVTNYGVCGKFVYNADENSVRLPKVTGFVEGTIDPYALGNLVEAGLPNITGRFEAKGINSEYGTINYGSGAFDVKVAAGYDETANAGSNDNVNTDVAEFDASQSNDIYGNSNTVQPQAIKGYYYMVIATVDAEQVGINGQSGTFLNRITNCVLEIPQRIKYTLEDNRLTVKTGSVMIVPYGTEDLTAQHPVGSAFLHENFKVYDTQFVDGKFFVLVETREDLKNKYSAETNTCHVFASINLGYGLTASDVASNTSGDTDTGTGTYRFWYDTANNFVKKFEGDATPVDDVFALPLMVAKSEVSVGWKSIDQVFNGFGYMGSTVWVDKNVKGLIPDGRNIDGSLNNVEFTIRNVSIMDTSSVYGGNYTLYLHKDTGIAVGSYWEYDKETNGFKHESSYNYGTLCDAGEIQLSNGRVTSLKPKTTFRVVDYNDIQDVNAVDGGGGLEIGDIGIAPLGIDETQNKRRYLNGQLILQNQFVSFTNKVKKAVELNPSIACTEEQWQATVTMSAFGQCGKFVIDDVVGTIRLPKITGFIQGLTDLASLGELVEAGLPNINASLGNIVVKANEAYAGGAFNVTQYFANNVGTGSSNYYNYAYFDFYASRLNATYGKSNTVQPESSRYPYFIQVATGVEESVDVTREIELNNPYSLGDSKYSPVALDNISWLKSEGQWNSKAVYPDYYNWVLVNANNGVADFKLSTNTYDDYSWVVNTADETFRLPLLNGEEDISGGTEYRLSNVENEVPFTCDKNGCYIVGTSSGTTGVGVSVTADNNTSGELQKCVASQTNQQVYASIKACRGDSVQFYLGGVNSFVSFAPYKGNGSLYFYVGDTVQNANLINAGRIEENVASIKSNVDAILRGSQNPDYSRAISIGQNYTCPSDGYIVLKTVVAGNGDQPVAYVNNVLISQFQNICPNAVRWGGGMFKVSKGDYIAQTWSEVLFIPEKGV